MILRYEKEYDLAGGKEKLEGVPAMTLQAVGARRGAQTTRVGPSQASLPNKKQPSVHPKWTVRLLRRYLET